MWGTDLFGRLASGHRHQGFLGAAHVRALCSGVPLPSGLGPGEGASAWVPQGSRASTNTGSRRRVGLGPGSRAHLPSTGSAKGWLEGTAACPYLYHGRGLCSGGPSHLHASRFHRKSENQSSHKSLRRSGPIMSLPHFWPLPSLTAPAALRLLTRRVHPRAFALAVPAAWHGRCSSQVTNS